MQHSWCQHFVIFFDFFALLKNKERLNFPFNNKNTKFLKLLKNQDNEMMIKYKNGA